MIDSQAANHLFNLWHFNKYVAQICSCELRLRRTWQQLQLPRRNLLLKPYVLDMAVIVMTQGVLARHGVVTDDIRIVPAILNSKQVHNCHVPLLVLFITSTNRQPFA